MNFIIETAEYGSANFDEMKALWSKTFGDPEEFVEAFYDCFGADIEAYVALDESGSVCSSLSCYKAGSYAGCPVYVSYAVCTREDCRGYGIAGELTEFVRDEVTSRGGISIVSPAEESLEEFYEKHGYDRMFFVAPRAVIAESFEEELEEYEFDEEDDFDIVRPEADIRKIDAGLYNKYREAYLAGVPHIEPSEEMLSAAELACEGFYAINNGDAICCVAENRRGQLILSELILSPVLLDLSSEIDSEVAQLLAAHFGAVEVIYSTPGAGKCQSMAAGEIAESEEGVAPPYFGFPIE